MKKSQKILATILTIIFCLNICIIPTYAADSPSSTFSLNNTSEIVEIEGTNYKYDFYMEAGMRTVSITNMSTNAVDIVAYNPATSTMYLNGSVFAEKIENSITPRSLGTTADGWEILSKDSHRITWAQGTTVAVVAGALAIYLATLGPAGVIAAMGTGTLGVLAASSSGGTLYVELDMYTAPFVTPQYRYVWSFTASTGDKYGPYYTPA